MNIIFFALINQTAQQGLGVIYNIRSCVAECGVGVVSKGQDSGIRNVKWEEVLQPKCSRLGICPGIVRMSVKSVDRNDTKWFRSQIYGDGSGS